MDTAVNTPVSQKKDKKERNVQWSCCQEKHTERNIDPEKPQKQREPREHTGSLTRRNLQKTKGNLNETERNTGPWSAEPWRNTGTLPRVRSRPLIAR